MFIFNINSIFIILICIYLLISNILLRKEIKKLTKQMRDAAENLEFERAAELRDAVHKLEDDLLLLE